MGVLDDCAVQTVEGIVPARCIDDLSLMTSDDASVAVHGVRRRAKCVELRTKQGYRLVCSEDTQLRTSSGWKRVGDARELVMAGYVNRTAVAGRALDATRRRMTLPVEHVRSWLRTLFVEEQSGGNRVVLPLRGREQIPQVQFALLSLGIRSGVDKRRIIVEPPWCAQYAETIGCVRESLTAHLRMAGGIDPPVVGVRAQKEIARLVQTQDYGSVKTHPELLTELQQLNSMALVGEMNAPEALRTAEIVMQLPYRDAFLRNLLVSVLRGSAQNTFLVEVGGVVQANRREVIDVPGHALVADGFVCRSG